MWAEGSGARACSAEACGVVGASRPAYGVGWGGGIGPSGGRSCREVHRSEVARLAALRAQWRPIFEKLPTVVAARARWRAQHGRRRPALQSAGPFAADFASAVQRVRSSALGPDGLRYDAWSVAGHVALKALSDVFWFFLAGGEVPEDFSQAFLVFLKDEVEGDGEKCVRDAGAPRPLGVVQTQTANPFSILFTVP